jgi:hypothetical protein
VPVVWPWQRRRGDRRGRSADLVEVRSVNPTGQPGPMSGPLSDPAFVAGLRPIPSGPLPGEPAGPTEDIVGTDPSGCPVTFRIDDVAGHLLLLFLHVHCDGCDEFWRGLREIDPNTLAPSIAMLAVTKGPGSVDRHEVERAAAGSRSVTVMSDKAWIDYRVTGYPHLILVDPSVRSIVAETVGFGWADVDSIVQSLKSS